MRFFCELLHSSIGKKALVAAAGLLLCGFLVAHLAGNLFLLIGESAFNQYAETLEKNPLIIPAEIGLAALFLLHMATSLYLRRQNSLARPIPYEASCGKGARTWGSRSMAATGILVLVFLAVHIRTFKFGDKSDGLYRLVVSSFADPFYALFYVVAMAGIALHLSHGVQSAFQTFGVNHPRYSPLIRKASVAFAVLIAGGFAFLPVWAYLTGGSGR